MNQQIQKAFEVLGFAAADYERVAEKDVVRAFFKLAKDFHPDKHPDEKDKTTFTEQFQRINNAYQTVLAYLQELVPDDPLLDDDDEDVNVNTDEVGTFTRDNFKNFNFPKQNDGSFTVFVQNDRGYSHLLPTAFLNASLHQIFIYSGLS